MKQRNRTNPFPKQMPKAPPMFQSRASDEHLHTGRLPNQGRKVEAEHATRDNAERRHLKHYGKKA